MLKLLPPAPVRHNATVRIAAFKLGFTILAGTAVGLGGEAVRAQVFTSSPAPPPPKSKRPAAKPPAGDIRANENDGGAPAAIHLPDVEEYQKLQRARSQHEVSIGSDGVIRYDGRTVTLTELSVLIVEHRKKDDRLTRINPAPGARFDRVMQTIRLFNTGRDPKFQISGNEAFSEIFEAKPLNYGSKQIAAFRDSSSAAQTLQFNVSSRAGAGDRCLVTFFGVAMGSADLRNYTYQVADAHLKRNWSGKSPQAADWPKAVVAAPGATLWKCAAGAIYNLQISGISEVSLVISKSG